MGFTKEQYESVARKIKLFSPAFEKGISQTEFEKRLKAIEQQIINKRLAWYEKNKDTFVPMERRSGDIIVTPLTKALALLFEGAIGVQCWSLPFHESGAWLHYYPESKLHVAYIESQNFCSYLKAFMYMRLSPKMSAYLCENVLEKPCQVIVEKVHPGIKFSRDYSHVRPHNDCCKEYLWLENYTPASFTEAAYANGPWGSLGPIMRPHTVDDILSYLKNPPAELNKLRSQR